MKSSIDKFLVFFVWKSSISNPENLFLGRNQRFPWLLRHSRWRRKNDTLPIGSAQRMETSHCKSKLSKVATILGEECRSY